MENSHRIDLKELILIDKPVGISSYKAIDRIKYILKNNGFKKEKIGHAGTLDPLASGLLVVGMTRNGTKQLGRLMEQDKTYVCEIDLLKDSDSGDMENHRQMIEEKEVNGELIPSLDKVKQTLDEQFTGLIQQTPPQYSVLKIGGKKAYELARKGITVEMKSRNVKIHSLKILRYEFPILCLEVKCSKGTYIRTLGQDIGKALGFFGTLLSLRRLQSGNHNIDNALSLVDVEINDLIK